MNTDPAFWRRLRKDWRGLRADAAEHKDESSQQRALQFGKFILHWESTGIVWDTPIPQSVEDDEEPIISWGLIQFPGRLDSQFRALALMGARGLDETSDSAWFKRLMMAPGFSKHTGHGHDRRGPNGYLRFTESGEIDDAIEASITVCTTIICELDAPPKGIGPEIPAEPAPQEVIRCQDALPDWNIKLRSARAERDLSRQQVAIALMGKGVTHISKEAVKKHEYGLAVPRPDVQKAYEELYGCEIFPSPESPR